MQIYAGCLFVDRVCKLGGHFVGAFKSGVYQPALEHAAPAISNDIRRAFDQVFFRARSSKCARDSSFDEPRHCAVGRAVIAPLKYTLADG